MRAADRYGIAAAGIRNSNHFGAAGYYCDIAAGKGYASMICSVGPPNMPPFGGMEAYFSTNPLAIGIPCARRPHIVVDMATSIASKGKIREAARKNEPIPPGWAIDSKGEPTTLLPGEIEWERGKKILEQRLELDAKLVAQFREIGKTSGIPFAQNERVFGKETNRNGLE